MSSVISYSDIQAENITASAVKSLDNGGKMVWINYAGAQGRVPLIMQTPVHLKAPYGISCWENESGPPKYSIELSLDGEEGEVFKNKLGEIDDKVLTLAMENGMSWFKKRVDRSVAEALYTPSLRYSRDKETGEISDRYPPVFKATLQHRGGKFMCEAYNMSKAPVDISALVGSSSMRGAAATAIVQCSGIWLAGGKFGMSWKVLQLLVKENATSLSPFAFIGGVSVPSDEDDAPTCGAVAVGSDTAYDNAAFRDDDDDF